MGYRIQISMMLLCDAGYWLPGARSGDTAMRCDARHQYCVSADEGGLGPDERIRIWTNGQNRLTVEDNANNQGNMRGITANMLTESIFWFLV